MASSSNLITMLVSILIIGMGMVSAARVTEETASPAPTPTSADEDLAPVSEKNEKFLIKCGEKITEKCGEEVYGGIFKNTDADKSISVECCKNLVHIGRKCHDELVKVIVSTPEFAPTKSITVPKSVDVWNNCAEAVHLLASSPY